MSRQEPSPLERGYVKSYYERAYFKDHPGKRRTNEEVIKHLSITGLHTGSVLDVGVGPGFLLRTLADAGFEVHGMDLTEDALGHARKNVVADLRLGDVCAKIPWPDAQFDAVILHDVIEHLHKAEAAMAEVHRVLRPGGLALISTLNEHSILHSLLGKRWCFYSDPTHVRVFNPASLIALLAQAGLNEVRHWTYFDLNKAGETTAWMRPLRSLARVIYVPRRGESLTVLAQKGGHTEPART